MNTQILVVGHAYPIDSDSSQCIVHSRHGAKQTKITLVTFFAHLKMRLLIPAISSPAVRRFVCIDLPFVTAISNSREYMNMLQYESAPPGETWRVNRLPGRVLDIDVFVHPISFAGLVIAGYWEPSATPGDWPLREPSAGAQQEHTDLYDVMLR